MPWEIGILETSSFDLDQLPIIDIRPIVGVMVDDPYDPGMPWSTKLWLTIVDEPSEACLVMTRKPAFDIVAVREESVLFAIYFAKVGLGGLSVALVSEGTSTF